MSNLPPDFNPYASPAAPDGLVQQPIVSSYQLLRDVKQFRAEIHALGGLWIFMGGIPLVLAGMMLLTAFGAEFDLDLVITASVLLSVAVPFLVCGVATCYKQLWGVYVGLVLSYLMTILFLLGSYTCFGVAIASGIFGGHRILSWAKELRRKGIPLGTRPRDMQTPLQLPAVFSAEKLELPVIDVTERPGNGG